MDSTSLRIAARILEILPTAEVWRGDGDAERGLPPYVYLDGKSKQRVFVVRALDLVVVRTGDNVRGWNDDAFVGAVVDAIE